LAWRFVVPFCFWELHKKPFLFCFIASWGVSQRGEFKNTMLKNKVHVEKLQKNPTKKPIASRLSLAFFGEGSV
jgi:hypothetical protein